MKNEKEIREREKKWKLVESFLTEKGLDIKEYRIMDVNGGYNAQIPIALWMIEFADLLNETK